MSKPEELLGFALEALDESWRASTERVSEPRAILIGLRTACQQRYRPDSGTALAQTVALDSLLPWQPPPA